MRVVHISESEYYRIYFLWVQSVFKKFINDLKSYDKFEKAVGIDSTNQLDIYELVDEQKFFLAVIKFSIDFKELKQIDDERNDQI